MKRLTALILILLMLSGVAITIRAAELLPIAFPFAGRWQPSEDATLIDDYGLQDIQNLRKSDKHFKRISGHTVINNNPINTDPYFINGFHFFKDQPQESHVLVVSASTTVTYSSSYLRSNTTAIPSAGEFLPAILHTDMSGGYGQGRFTTAPGGNMVYANGPETLIWGGNEIEPIAFFRSADSLTTASAAISNPQDFTDAVRNARQDANETVTIGSGLDSYVKLLLHGDGTDGSTVITDASSVTRTLTAYNSAQLDTAQLKFGTASMMFTAATSDYIATADSSDWSLGSSDFTIDGWIRISPVAGVVATGGTVTYSGGYATHTFTSSGNFVVTQAGSIDYLVVGGGGGGDQNAQGGGGGAGGMLTGSLSVTTGTKVITIGAGGAVLTGGDSTAFDDGGAQQVKASGGGRGGPSGGHGGSGGGGRGTTGAAGTGIVWQGNNGAAGSTDGSCDYGGGGGGAGGAGQTGASCFGGTGGIGSTSSLSGSTVTYAKGGQGCSSDCPGTAGSANTGNGGDSGWTTGGAGGSGIVIIRYPLALSPGPILTQTQAGSKGWSFGTGVGTLEFTYSTDGTTTTTKSVSWVPLSNIWYHIAVARSGSNLRFFVDGLQTGSTQTVTGVTIAESTATLKVGTDGTSYFGGWIDELRLSNGTARWITDFTVQTSAYSAGTGYWFMGFTRPIQGVKLYLTNPNNFTSTMTVQEWNGVSWTTLSTTDNTSSGGISLAQTGAITWPTTETTSKVRYLNGLSLYWYQFKLSQGSATIYYTTVDAPMQSIKNVWDGKKYYVSKAMKYDGSKYVDYTDAVNDSLDTTYLDLSAASTVSYALVAYTAPLQGFELTMVANAQNTNASTTATAYYWNGSTLTATPYVSDGTATSTTSLNKTGVISFAPIATGLEFPTSVGDEAALYYYKVSFAATLSSTVRISEIRVIPAPQPIASYSFGAAFQNRLFLFNEYGGAKNKSIYSVDNSPDIFNGEDSGELYFGQNTDIIGAQSIYNVVGSEAQNQLIVTKKNETYRLTGDGPDSWVSSRISANIGAVAPLSMVSCELAASKDTAPRQVVIWQGDKGFYMTDGSVIVSISDDIKAYFDPNDSRYIPTSRKSKTVAWYDPHLKTYKALISSGSTATYHNIELEYSLENREWTKIYREDIAGADPLQSGFQVWDTNGIGYTYGGNTKGTLYRLENGQTFAGATITSYIHTKDLILDSQAPMFRKSTVKYVRTAHKKKALGGTIAVSHYGDQVLTVSGSSNQVGVSTFGTSTTPYDTQSVNLGPFLYHSFKFTTTNDTTAGGAELTGLGLWVEPYTAIR